MKTLLQPEVLASLRTRLASLTPNDTARWGSMSVAGMVCHLSDSFQGALGERPAAPVKPPPIPLSLFKWFALVAPIRWPHGVPTVPEVQQGVGGTPPGNFHADLELLLRRLDAFAVSTGPAPHHPIFGPLTLKERMSWGFRHTDHHLRQFGR